MFGFFPFTLKIGIIPIKFFLGLFMTKTAHGAVTRMTQKYIGAHPTIKDCMRRGVVNFSALSRQICEEYDFDQFDAVLIACRRYYNRVKNQESNEKAIHRLLQRAKLRIKSPIMVVIIEKAKDLDKILSFYKAIKADKGDFHIIEGESVFTLITNTEYYQDVKDAFRNKIKKVTRDLVAISMLFDERIETTTGVVSYVYGLMAYNNINVLEEMSCWTDLVMVIHEEDLPRALKVLNFDKSDI